MESNSLPTRTRLDYLDYARGLVIVLMALDHTRDFWGISGGIGGPENVASTTPAWFFTRWITHFCAPTFVFLAGVGAWLYRQKKSAADTAIFLFTRGLLLVAFEFTLVKFGWSLNWEYNFVMLQVIWAIGISMILLAPLVMLSSDAALAVGLILVLGHNALDALKASHFGHLGWLWELAHINRPFRPFPVWLPKLSVFNLYPFLPWFGVMALGYGMGSLFTQVKSPRWALIRLGLAMTAAFLLLRWCNGYGNPMPWKPQKEEFRTVMAFLNCTKYPPSLDYLLMTLGPMLLLLGMLPAEPGWVSRPLVIFGRVPMFFYLLHLPVIHGLADWAKPWLPTVKTGFLGMGGTQRGFGVDGVYLVWAAAVVLLFFPCWGYSKLKAKYGGLLRYL